MIAIALPGWANDSRCWNKVKMAWNRLTHRSEPLQWIDVPWNESLPGTEGPNALFQAIEATSQPVVLLGWSLGGMLAIEAALRYPNKMRALVLVSTSARFCEEIDAGIVRYPGTSARIVRGMRMGLRGDAHKVLRDFFTLALSPDIPESVLDRSDYSFPPGDLQKGLDYLIATDLRDALPCLSAPVRILHGTCDRIIPIEVARILHERLPNASLREIEEKGHDLVFTAPEAIAEELRHVAR
jgi:pimeloyl-[acyl-carrier protein] methyl ester esterase